MQSTPEQLNAAAPAGGVRTSLQSIHADYYNLTDLDGWPVAGLLVLADRRGRAVRAELHLYSDTVGQPQEMAYRHAESLLTNRYHRHMTDNPRLPLRIMRTRQEQDTLYIPLQQQSLSASWIAVYGRQAVTTAVGFLLVLAVVLGVNAMSQRSETQNGSEILPESAVTLPAALSNGAETAGATEAPAEPTNPPPPAETNGLPPSVNALPLEVNQRVRVRQDMQLTIRTEPGAFAGQELGFMLSGQEADTIGGPVWQRGESDTIVWWYVRLDSGMEGWVPANTSRHTVLEPAQ